MINFGGQWRAYLWQGRFSSFPMEEKRLLKAVAYVELNPVKAGMVDSAWDYPWSNVHVHLSGYDNLGLVNSDKILSIIGNWKSYLLSTQNQPMDNFAKHERTGRPLGRDSFIDMAESLLDRDLKKKKPEPKATDEVN